MDIQITKEKENKTIGRREIEFAGEGERITPSREKVLEKLAERLAIREEFITIKEIRNVYGSHSFTGIAHVYQKKERMAEIEPGYLLKRGVKEEKKGEAPKAAEEKPKEHKKEEAKKEEKPKEAKKE
ncbi:hypothetical protein AUJ17_02825 [Candidatus Micrarchaeota archaeon CG1_02_47_40]|nr:MAG: hypothetical protein AUJ17_02825 [Candidatus Micrarchaeota archaeon CG1_02_47_40]